MTLVELLNTLAIAATLLPWNQQGRGRNRTGGGEGGVVVGSVLLLLETGTEFLLLESGVDRMLME